MGGNKLNIYNIGETFDECCNYALKFQKENKSIFIHPFNDYRVIAGAGTAALELLDKINEFVQSNS